MFKNGAGENVWTSVGAGKKRIKKCIARSVFVIPSETNRAIRYKEEEIFQDMYQA